MMVTLKGSKYLATLHTIIGPIYLVFCAVEETPSHMTDKDIKEHYNSFITKCFCFLLNKYTREHTKTKKERTYLDI